MNEARGTSGFLYESRKDNIKETRERAMGLYRELADLEQEFDWWQQAELQKPEERIDYKQIAEWKGELSEIRTKLSELDDVILELFEAEDSLRKRENLLTELNELEELIKGLKSQIGLKE